MIVYFKWRHLRTGEERFASATRFWARIFGICCAASVFPIILHSTLAPEDSLSACQNAAAGHGLAIALVWWPVALIFAIVYFPFIYRHYSGKVKPLEDTQRPY